MKVIRKTQSSMFGMSGLLVALALALTLAAPVQAQEREYYITIAPPDKLGQPQLPTTASTAFGTNDRGDVVGSFTEGTGQNAVTHGFLLSKGEFTVIDFPGAQSTIARGINYRGDIIGSYRLPGDPALGSRGFLRTITGEFVNVRYPGHSWETLQRILPDGTILGCRHDQDQMVSMRGVRIGRDGASEIDAFSSMNNGATPDLRRTVGWWVDMMLNAPQGQTQGYIIQDGVFTPFMVPGSNGTQAWDVNLGGAIVGQYNVGTTVRGFLRTEDGDQATYTTIHYRGATTTRAFGINARGDIVGNYVLDGVTRAFLAPEVTTRTRVRTLIEAVSYFVRLHYLDFLNREPDEGGWAFWSAQILQCAGDAQCIDRKRLDVSRAFFYSGELITRDPRLAANLRGTGSYNEAFVEWCYRTYLQREPDSEGFNFWVNKLNSRIPNVTDADYTEMIRAFITSAEYQARLAR